MWGTRRKRARVKHGNVTRNEKFAEEETYEGGNST